MVDLRGIEKFSTAPRAHVLSPKGVTIGLCKLSAIAEIPLFPTVVAVSNSPLGLWGRYAPVHCGTPLPRRSDLETRQDSLILPAELLDRNRVRLWRLRGVRVAWEPFDESGRQVDVFQPYPHSSGVVAASEPAVQPLGASLGSETIYGPCCRCSCQSAGGKEGSFENRVHLGLDAKTALGPPLSRDPDVHPVLSVPGGLIVKSRVNLLSNKSSSGAMPRHLMPKGEPRIGVITQTAYAIGVHLATGLVFQGNSKERTVLHCMA
jgi:hypothetical protein